MVFWKRKSPSGMNIHMPLLWREGYEAAVADMTKEFMLSVDRALSKEEVDMLKAEWAEQLGITVQPTHIGIASVLAIEHQPDEVLLSSCDLVRLFGFRVTLSTFHRSNKIAGRH